MWPNCDEFIDISENEDDCVWQPLAGQDFAWDLTADDEDHQPPRGHSLLEEMRIPSPPPPPSLQIWPSRRSLDDFFELNFTDERELLLKQTSDESESEQVQLSTRFEGKNLRLDSLSSLGSAHFEPLPSDEDYWTSGEMDDNAGLHSALSLNDIRMAAEERKRERVRPRKQRIRLKRQAKLRQPVVRIDLIRMLFQ